MLSSASFPFQLQVPVTPVSQAGSPVLAGNTCQNVVAQVGVLTSDSGLMYVDQHYQRCFIFH